MRKSLNLNDCVCVLDFCKNKYIFVFIKKNETNIRASNEANVKRPASKKKSAFLYTYSNNRPSFIDIHKIIM